MKHDSAIADYVDASCTLHGLSLDPEQRRRIIDTFALTAALVAPLLAYELPLETEAAPIFNA